MVISHTNESIYVDGMVKYRLGTAKLQTGYLRPKFFECQSGTKRLGPLKNVCFLFAAGGCNSQKWCVGGMVKCRLGTVKLLTRYLGQKVLRVHREKSGWSKIFSIFLLWIVVTHTYESICLLNAQMQARTLNLQTDFLDTNY